MEQTSSQIRLAALDKSLKYAHEQLQPYRINITNAELYYVPKLVDFVRPGYADDLFAKLMTHITGLGWEQGKTSLGMERRQTKLFSTRGNYHYSGIEKEANTFPECLDALRDYIQRLFGLRFDTCLANLYANGQACIGAHADKETDLVRGAPIVSISLGCERKFRVFGNGIDLQSKIKPILANMVWEQMLAHGSMVVMWNDCQKYYKHEVPPVSVNSVKDPRINLTFRVTHD